MPCAWIGEWHQQLVIFPADTGISVKLILIEIQSSWVNKESQLPCYSSLWLGEATVEIEFFPFTFYTQAVQDILAFGQGQTHRHTHTSTCSKWFQLLSGFNLDCTARGLMMTALDLFNCTNGSLAMIHPYFSWFDFSTECSLAVWLAVGPCVNSLVLWSITSPNSTHHGWRGGRRTRFRFWLIYSNPKPRQTRNSTCLSLEAMPKRTICHLNSKWFTKVEA